MALLNKDFTDYAKLALITFFVGIPIAYVLGAVASALASYFWLYWIILAFIGAVIFKQLPKEMDTFWEALIVVFFLMAFQGFVGMLFPSISLLQWASIVSTTGLLTTLVVASVVVWIEKKYI